MRVGISCSELSGEHHAALLCDALGDKLADRNEELTIFGLGSERLKAAGAELYDDIAGWAAMGAVSNLVNMGKMLLARKKTPQGIVDDFAKFLLARRPDVVVLVDSRVLNLAVAQRLRKSGYDGRIVYHVAPVRWESCFDDEFFEKPENLARFRDFKPLVDFFFLIYPVSEQAYEKLELPYLFIGHPMVDFARPTLARDKFARVAKCDPPLDPALHWIALFPGSRWEEVKAITPTLLEAAKNLVDRYFDLQFILPVAHPVFAEFIRGQVSEKGLAGKCSLTGQDAIPDVICGSRAVIAKSGTVLHLCTLAVVPMVMVYDVSPAQRWVAEKVLNFGLRYYAFPNIIAKRAIIPELINEKFSPPTISVEASHLIRDTDRRNKMCADLVDVRAEIVKPDPLGTAADKIIELAGS